MNAAIRTLRSCLEAARDGRLQAGYDQLRPLLDAGERAVLLEAAPLLVALHRTREAIERLDGRREDRVAARLSAELAARAGLDAEAAFRLEALAEREGQDSDLRERLVKLRLSRRDYEGVMALESTGDAGFEAALGLGQLTRAHQLAESDPARLRRLGDHASDPVGFALRKGQIPEACSDARVALIQAFRAGDGATMLAWLETEQDLATEEALVWKAEAHVLRNEIGPAYAALDQALARAGRPHLPALLRRLSLEMRGDLARVEAGEMHREQTTDGDGLHLASEVREALHEMWGEDRFVGIDLVGVIALLESSLERLGYHRSADVTFVSAAGTLRPLFVHSPREDSRRQLERIRVARGNIVRQGLRDLRARWPGSESPLVHEGELELWLGNYEAAVACFEGALARAHGTRWAYIGLGGARMMMGELDEALRVHAEGVRVLGSEIGSLFIYRGEARRRAGKDAASDLEKALSNHPARLSAWINLALHDESRADWAADRLRDHGPLLVEDTLGARAFEGAGWTRADFERVLDALGGNRSSSCVTYRPNARAEGDTIPADLLRTVQRPRLQASGENESRRQALMRGLSRRWAHGTALL